MVQAIPEKQWVRRIYENDKMMSFSQWHTDLLTSYRGSDCHVDSSFHLQGWYQASFYLQRGSTS